MSDSDRESARRGFESQEIKKVKEADILSFAMERGKNISDITQGILGRTLKSKIQENGIETALEYCNLNAYPIVDSLSNVYSAVIKRVSFKNRNPENYPDSIESVFLEAYQYSLDHGGQVTDNIQELGDDYLLYTRPILIGDPLCLQCHGELQEEISPGTEKIINKLYPEDKAIGYKITQLRGMWSIEFKKKEIVKDL